MYSNYTNRNLLWGIVPFAVRPSFLAPAPKRASTYRYQGPWANGTLFIPSSTAPRTHLCKRCTSMFDGVASLFRACSQTPPTPQLSGPLLTSMPREKTEEYRRNMFKVKHSSCMRIVLWAQVGIHWKIQLATVRGRVDFGPDVWRAIRVPQLFHACRLETYRAAPLVLPDLLMVLPD